jgi:hypothetical protein
MGLAHVISPEERESFRRCRRAWDLGSPNRRNLVPRDARAGVQLAPAVRMAMAVWYFPGMWEWPRAIVLPRARQAFEEAVARRPAPREAVDAARSMLERYFAWAPTVDAFSPVRVEADFEAGVPDPRTPGHELVDGDGRPVRYHDRIHTLIVDAHDAYWVVEHRLAEDGWADRDELLLAERPVAAAWGWEQFYLGMEFAGTVHNELRLASEEREDDDLGEGRVARRPRSRDWARSRAAGRPAASRAPTGPMEDETAEVRVQEGGGWFRRTWIRRSRTEVNAVADHLFAEAIDMLDPGLRAYPSPAPEHCGPCDYRPPCLAMNEGTDVGAVLAEAYRVREENRPEEGRLGGGSWSMNRGAAPPPQWRSPGG